MLSDVNHQYLTLPYLNKYLSNRSRIVLVNPALELQLLATPPPASPFLQQNPGRFDILADGN